MGALILDPEYLPDVAEIVEISAFSDANNSKIYGAMLSMLERGDKIDLYTLADRPELKGREMTRYLVELTNAVGSGVNVLEHARKLRDTETRRRMCLFGYELAVRAVSDPDGVVDWATTEITAIADRAVRSDDITPLSDVVRAALDDLERRQQARQAGECIGIPTGLQRLDAPTGGWRGGQLVVLAGRPGMGKSAAMIHFARTAAVSGVPVCVFSLEMPAGQLAGRMLVGYSGVNSQAFRVGSVDADGWHELEQAAADLSAMPVYLNDRVNITMGAIRSQCKAMARRGRCGMVIIDYLQLLADGKTKDRYQAITGISIALHELAQTTGILVVALAQLNRNADRIVPSTADLKESGQLEQDADAVLLLVENIITNDKGQQFQASLAKNKEGQTGPIPIQFDKERQRFLEIDARR